LRLKAKECDLAAPGKTMKECEVSNECELRLAEECLRCGCMVGYRTGVINQVSMTTTISSVLQRDDARRSNYHDEVKENEKRHLE
jgi:hypothetical protein